jgi:ankyrin repeat protein
MKSLIDKELKSTDQRITAYFFFKEDNIAQRSASGALSALLHQIFSHSDFLLRCAMSTYLKDGDKFVGIFDSLWDILVSVASDPDVCEILCILDALDECEEADRNRIIKKLSSFYGGPHRSSRLKFLISSRPYSHIENQFHSSMDNAQHIRLKGENESEAISKEIDLVISYQVHRLKPLLAFPEYAEVLEQKLLDIPHRTYLWLHLILGEFRDTILDTDELSQLIETIPRTLNDTYESLLKKIDERDEEQARKLLHIIVGAERPLTLRELSIALLMTKKGEVSSIDRLPDDDKFRSKIRSLCSLFVTVVDSKIYLIHQTAREFLIDNNNKSSFSSIAERPIWQGSLVASESNLIMAQVCMNYLLLQQFEESPLLLHDEYAPSERPERDKICFQYLKLHEFLEYAAEYWISHYIAAQTDDSSMLKTVLNIMDAKSRRFRTWLSIYWIKRSTAYNIPLKWTNLFIASFAGCELVVRNLLEDEKVDICAKDSFKRTSFMWAVIQGHFSISQMILPYAELEINLKDNYGWTPLYGAAVSGHAKIAELLLDRGANIAESNEDGWSPLNAASHDGHIEVVKLLLDRGADIDMMATNNKGWTPLNAASNTGQKDIVKLLLDRGADMTVPSNDGWLPLSEAAFNGHKDVAELLLDRGADLMATNDRGWTPVNAASNSGQKDVVKLLLDRGADITVSCKYGWLPLGEASFNGHKDVVELLLDRGADLMATNDKGWTPVNAASNSGQKDVVKLLLDRGADLTVPSKDGWTPVNEAASNGRKDVVELLLDRGADLTVPNNEGWTPILEASNHGHRDVVELLLDRGANLADASKDGWTPIIAAADSGHKDVVELLLDRGANLTDTTNNGWTSIIAASEGGHKDVVELLLERGANVADATSTQGWTSILEASNNGHRDVVELLLDWGADVGDATKNGWTSILLASDSGHADVVELLLNSGADVTDTTVLGWTSILAASEGGHMNVVKLLLGRGANKTDATKMGSTSLHLAAKNGHRSVVELLLTSGVNPDVLNKFGLTPAFLALENRHNIIYELLVQHGARRECLDKHGRPPAVSSGYERCDGCGARFPDSVKFYHCESCEDGFDLCDLCFELKNEHDRLDHPMTEKHIEDGEVEDYSCKWLLLHHTYALAADINSLLG